MFINKHISCTIVAYIGVVGLVSNWANAENEFTADEFLGRWYTIATLDPSNAEHELRCNQREVTKGSSDQFFNVYDTAVAPDGKYSTFGDGDIRNAVYKKPGLLLKFLQTNEFRLFYYDTLNNGEEFIVHDMAGPNSLELHSRKPTVSDEGKAAFEEEADKLNSTVIYIDQDDCD